MDMEPTIGQLTTIATQFDIWDIQNDIKEYNEYLTECAENDEEPMNFEDFMLEDTTAWDDELKNTQAWGLR